MCAPTRYTTRHRSVKRIFSFSSGTLNRLGSRGAVMRSARDRTARLLDLRAGGGRYCHALHAELALNVPHAEQLDGAVRPAHQPRAEQRVGCDLDALGEPAQVPHVHHLRRLLERVGKAALGNAADERHLPALEPGPGLTPGARRLALPAPAGGLADSGAGPAALARGRQHAVATGLAFAILPGGRLPSHAPPPGGPCSESPRARPHAPGRRAAPS